MCRIYRNSPRLWLARRNEETSLLYFHANYDSLTCPLFPVCSPHCTLVGPPCSLLVGYFPSFFSAAGMELAMYGSLRRLQHCNFTASPKDCNRSDLLLRTEHDASQLLWTPRSSPECAIMSLTAPFGFPSKMLLLLFRIDSWGNQIRCPLNFKTSNDNRSDA